MRCDLGLFLPLHTTLAVTLTLVPYVACVALTLDLVLNMWLVWYLLSPGGVHWITAKEIKIEYVKKEAEKQTRKERLKNKRNWLSNLPSCLFHNILCFFYPWGRVWIHQPSLSSGHHRNGIWQWPSSPIPWFS